MSSPVKLFVGAAATALLLSKILSLAEQDHTFVPTKDIPTRQARFSQLDAKQGEPLKQFGYDYFLNQNGLFIHIRRWIPLASSHPVPKGLVVLVHGLGEHIARYQSVALALNQAGFIVYGLDHIGHGRSEGDRLHLTESFEDYVNDVLQVVQIAKRENPTLVKKTFLFGHSMGGLITILTNQKSSHEFAGLVISGPALVVADPPPAIARTLLNLLSSLLPKLPVDGLSLDTLANFKPVIDQYNADPLVHHGKIPAKLLNGILESMDKVKPELLSSPYLLFHGEQDKICLMHGSENFHAKTTSKDKTFEKVQGGHETLNEPDGKAIVLAVNWLKARI